MQEHDVEVAERAELSPPVATHRDQRHSLAVPVGGPVEQTGQPLVGRLGVGVAERVPSQVVALDERLAQGTQGHGGPYHRAPRRTATDRSPMGDDTIWPASITLGSCARDRHRSLAPRSAAGLSVFDGVLIVGGGLIALFVAFEVLGFIASVLWFLVKLVVVVALIALVVKLVFRRRS